MPRAKALRLKGQASMPYKHPHVEEPLKIGFYYEKPNFFHRENNIDGINQQSIYHTSLHNKFLSG
jgi:hypothetical protein